MTNGLTDFQVGPPNQDQGQSSPRYACFESEQSSCYIAFYRVDGWFDEFERQS